MHAHIPLNLQTSHKHKRKQENKKNYRHRTKVSEKASHVIPPTYYLHT